MIANGLSTLSGLNVHKVAKVVYKVENEPSKFWLAMEVNHVVEILKNSEDAIVSNVHVGLKWSLKDLKSVENFQKNVQSVLFLSLLYCFFVQVNHQNLTKNLLEPAKNHHK